MMAVMWTVRLLYTVQDEARNFKAAEVNVLASARPVDCIDHRRRVSLI